MSELIAFDLRPAFLDVALGRTTALGRVVDLRILATLVAGGVQPNEEQLPSSLAVCDLPVWRQPQAMADKLTHKVIALGLWPVVELEHELLPIVANMVARGLTVDAGAWSTLRAERARALQKNGAFLSGALSIRNPSDKKALLRALRARGFDASGVGKDALAAFRGNRIVEAVVAFNAHESFANDAGPNIADALRAHPDGRLRGNIDPLGTVTGRFTITEPNLLGLEKVDEVRRCIIAAPDHVLISTDLKAAELRVLAALVGEENLIEAFRRGTDPHRYTASRIFNIAPDRVDPAQRRLGKIANFTIVFGGGPAAITEQCGAAGMTMSGDAASKLFDDFCSAYPRIAAWLDTSGEDLSIARSALGRIRIFHHPHVAAWLNAPVQMTAADAIKFAMLDIAPQLTEIGAHLLLCVHDELVVEAPASVAERAASIVRTGMVQQCEETLGHVVPFEVDQFYGPTWAESDATWVWSSSTHPTGAA